MAGAHRGPRTGRAGSRIRYDKAAALGVSVAVTGFAMVTGLGQLSAPAADGPSDVSRARAATAVDTPRPSQAAVAASDASALPARSGTGRRVVFDQSAQRVWLVGPGDRVLRTYLVSGSVTDNLRPGHYEVYSRSRNAVGVDDSGTMNYFVRFTRGQNAAIGFHDIPVNRGHKVQTVAQLGTPTSHGCIRQRPADAKVMWGFADLGTKVDVVA
ncbi:hypothetical protein GCM10011519_12260 [Marmoricola endophyticus]|uniref:L,D-TPase catalytic domain-containing protein n=1 Tax=Marmoricola endophyticus TaxID=2040280 RepID=A0A917BEE0_9ACTN|nr:L,D-transpeptidase [Marmoricola endophyticus]GGF40134.1 hypothetical protein GCM10011519_12260 [Marmoricola endophyticus]